MTGIVSNPVETSREFPPAQGWITRDSRFMRLRHGLWLLGRYFVSREAPLAWALLLIAVGFQFSSVWLALWSNAFDKTMFDAIGAREGGKLPYILTMYLLIGMATATNASVGDYLRQVLTIRWRRWLAEDYSGRWLARERFYAIERATLVENPDQRISEDVRIFVEGALMLGLSLINVVTSTISFGIVLWRLSSPVDLGFIGLPFVIPGDLVWASLIYSALATWALYKFGQPLVRRQMEQQHYEADFRYLLVQLRRNAEQVALARLGKAEWHRLIGLYQRVKRNFLGLQFVTLVINVATPIAARFNGLLPLLLTLPRYFAGSITMGDLVQTQTAFSAFSVSLSWPMQAYGQFAQTLAAVNRLYGLDIMVEAPARPGVEVQEADGFALQVEGLRLRLPDGTPLTPIGDWTIAAGQRWVVRGASGVGKSTLLRAIAGIWPEGEGRIAIPRSAQIMFVPQRAYLGNGSLRSILAFPHAPEHFSQEACREALCEAQLGQFAERIEEGAPWSETMSPGEQQRIAFARIVLHRPTHIFLDEATSALDPETAQAMYRLLALFPDLTVVSVVHNPALDRFHDHRLDIGGAGASSTVLPTLRDTSQK